MITCPSCGAAVPIRSAALVYAVCGYCQTLLRREGLAAADIGRVAALPEDISPIQLRSRGRWNGIGFTVVGRVRWDWQDGQWNEWLLLPDRGDHWWLGEGAGTWLITAARRDLHNLGALHARWQPGMAVRVDNTDYVCADVREARCLGGEGDLPFKPLPDETLRNADFRSSAGLGLSFQRHGQDELSAWAGQWCRPADLAMTNLREVPGWVLPASLQQAARS